MKPWVSAVISAAGRGARMGFDTNKLLIDFEGKTIIERTLEALREVSFVSHYVLVIRPEEEEVMAKIAEKIFSGLSYSLAYGGATREASTRSGIEQCPKNTEVILTHDGARPFVSKKIIEDCYNTFLETKADGTIVVVPVKDTIKTVDAKGFVSRTPKRSMLYQVQTPQIFWKDLLLEAYDKALQEKLEVTDDAQIVELFGGRVSTSLGDYSNIKITTKEDLLLGKMIIKKREKDD